MQSKNTWVVVANGSMARIFNLSKDLLSEVEVLVHPEARKHTRELISEGSPQKNELEHFAKEVAQHLELAHGKNLFQGLHVIASPAFLGLLRHSLHAATKKSVLSELSKDLVEESPLQIRSYLA
ncbi:MAG: host attachment protein [Myxococcaceae bacterium]